MVPIIGSQHELNSMAAKSGQSTRLPTMFWHAADALSSGASIAAPRSDCVQVPQADAKLQEVALQLLKLLGRCQLPGTAQAAGSGHPVAQACMLYVLQTAVLPRLPEAAQVRSCI